MIRSPSSIDRWQGGTLRSNLFAAVTLLALLSLCATPTLAQDPTTTCQTSADCAGNYNDRVCLNGICTSYCSSYTDCNDERLPYCVAGACAATLPADVPKGGSCGSVTAGYTGTCAAPASCGLDLTCGGVGATCSVDASNPYASCNGPPCQNGHCPLPSGASCSISSIYSYVQCSGTQQCQYVVFQGTLCAGPGAYCDANFPCDSQYACDSSSKTCQVPPQPTGALSSTRRKRRALQELRKAPEQRWMTDGQIALTLGCQGGQVACEIGEGRVSCVSPDDDLESCGGCPPYATDCTAIPGADAVQCLKGACLIDSCIEGFRWINGTCWPAL